MDAVRRRNCRCARRWLGVLTIPCIGAMMEFRVVSSVQSVDAPGKTLTVRK